MPIKWSALLVSEAMDMAEEYVNQAIDPLEQALVVAQEATRIPNLPDYMKGNINRLIGEIERVIPGIRYGHQSPGSFKASIQNTRDSIPEGMIEADKAMARAGTQQSLLV